MAESPQTHSKDQEPGSRGKIHPQPAVPQAAPEPTTAPSEEVERLRAEAKEAKDQCLRALAEFDNSKKRLHREKEEFIRFASETMVRGLLPIVDSLDQALVAIEKHADPQAISKGVHLIYRQLLGLLAKEGVERIPTKGERFDPHKHEAVAQIETTKHLPENSVVEEVQVGYTMHGKVIRPAMVKVSKRPTDQKSEVRGQKSEEQGPETGQASRSQETSQEEQEPEA